MIIAATVFMVLFGLMSIVDGLYYHDYKYKLYLHKESILEHIMHTFRAVAFPLVVYYLFQNDFGGWMMMVGVFVAFIDIILLAIDVRIEGHSRDRYGGLSNGEYATHLFANTFHYVSKTMKNDRVCFVQGFPLFWGCEARVEVSLRPSKRPTGPLGCR